MTKPLMKPKAVRRVVLLQSYGHLMTSFLWSVRVHTTEKCGRFVLYHNTENLPEN